MKDSKMGTFSRFTRRDVLIFSALACVNFANTLCASLQAPFYPQEAEKKGATASEYGLVFGIYELVAFISCPIFGKYISKLGAKNILIGGIVTTGTSVILFGMLNLVNSHGWFITLSFLIRIIESLGAAASRTASFSVTAVAFPGSIATMFASLEIFYGVGFIFGPSIGGFLFEVGGFTLPFATIGGLLLLIGLFVCFALPKTYDAVQMDKPPAQIFSLLKLTPVVLDVFSMAATTLSMGYYSATLEPHLRQFNLSPLGVGGMFVIIGVTHTLSAPLIGRLCDTRLNPRKVIIVGSFLVIVSFSLVGPAPYMPFDTTLWVVCVGLVFQGLGFSCLLVSCFIDAIQSAVAYGYPEDITTYGLVSGTIISAFSLGGFIGPSVAGFLFNLVGFKNGTLFVIAVNGVLIVGMTWFVCAKPRSQLKLDTDSEPPGVETEHLSRATEILPLISKQCVTESSEGETK